MEMPVWYISLYAHASLCKLLISRSNRELRRDNDRSCKHVTGTFVNFKRVLFNIVIGYGCIAECLSGCKGVPCDPICRICLFQNRKTPPSCILHIRCLVIACFLVPLHSMFIFRQMNGCWKLFLLLLVRRQNNIKVAKLSDGQQHNLVICMYYNVSSVFKREIPSEQDNVLCNVTRTRHTLILGFVQAGSRI